MALTSTIALNASSVEIEERFNATITVSNSGSSPVQIVDILPTCREANDPIPEDASSYGSANRVHLSGSNNMVPASGSMQYSFGMNIHAPSGGPFSPSYSGPSLGRAEPFAILAGSAITNTGASVINGDVGISPSAAITPGGWTVNGTVHNNDSTAADAQTDLTAAYVFLAAMTPTATLTDQDLGTVGPLGPGVYFFASSAGLTGTLTLDGQNDPSSVFVFQIGSTLTTASSSSVVLINGAVAGNVFFQVGSSATLGTGTKFQGNIVALTSITENGTAGATSGRLLARNGAVTISGASTTSTEKNSGEVSVGGSYMISAQISALDGTQSVPPPASIVVTKPAFVPPF